MTVKEFRKGCCKIYIFVLWIASGAQRFHHFETSDWLWQNARKSRVAPANAVLALKFMQRSHGRCKMARQRRHFRVCRLILIICGGWSPLDAYLEVHTDILLNMGTWHCIYPCANSAYGYQWHPFSVSESHNSAAANSTSSRDSYVHHDIYSSNENTLLGESDTHPGKLIPQRSWTWGIPEEDQDWKWGREQTKHTGGICKVDL